MKIDIETIPLKWLRLLSASIVVFVTLFVTVGVVKSQSPTRKAAGIQEILDKMASYPDLLIPVENPADVPLLIHDVRVKELTRLEYAQVMGLHRDSERSVSFPEVKLVNATNKRITGFVLLLKNWHTGQAHFLRHAKIVIDPSNEYFIAAHEWRDQFRSVIYSTDGQPESGEQVTKPPLTLASPYMWMPGSSDDLAVKVGMVEFEDGTSWTIDRTSSWN